MVDFICMGLVKLWRETEKNYKMNKMCLVNTNVPGENKVQISYFEYKGHKVMTL